MSDKTPPQNLQSIDIEQLKQYQETYKGYDTVGKTRLYTSITTHIKTKYYLSDVQATTFTDKLVKENKTPEEAYKEAITPTATGSTGSTGSTGGTPPAKKSSNMLLIILIICLVVLAIVIGVFFYRRHQKSVVSAYYY